MIPHQVSQSVVVNGWRSSRGTFESKIQWRDNVQITNTVAFQL